MTVTVAVLGASGRMGQQVLAALAANSQVECTAAVVRDDSSALGKRVEGHAELVYCTLADAIAARSQVFIDFSLPVALLDNLTAAREAGAAIVVCTTGLTAVQQQQLQQAGEQQRVLYAANTSVGVNLLAELVQLASGVLAQADIEITEAHHRHKRDAPSGTALLLGEAAAQGRQQVLADVSAGIRGDGLRGDGEIGFASIRAADIIGEHTVMLAQTGERLELTHRVSNRTIFAKGALQAAQWLVQQEPGYYQMRDMLNLQQLLSKLA
ncbi:MAG: 4-hydroxy-tetrahydrodipicolinate reductase [Idiomarina sp.]